MDGPRLVGVGARDRPRAFPLRRLRRSRDVAAFDIAVDFPRAEAWDRDIINTLDADLSAFFAAGGKLLQNHGWADPQTSPGNSTQYYARVTEAVGGDVGDSYRLFMAPGMARCGGDGPNTFDAMAALEAWVERGARSAGRTASRARPRRSRAAALSVPATGRLHGAGQHGRGVELRVPLEAAHRLVCRGDRAVHVPGRMGGRQEPRLELRRRRVDAAREHPAEEARVTRRVAAGG